MKKTGAFLAVYALEQIGVKFTFGIPGVHNTELYDELNNSKKITPMLVTHEGGGAFMADGVSRTSDSIGTLAIVPAAGTTNALSGIGEAYLDGVPLLVISGGTRRDSGRQYQLHQVDLEKIVGALVKKYYLIEEHEAIIPTIYEAYERSISGEPGPVFVEIPLEIQLFQAAVNHLPKYKAPAIKKPSESSAIQSVVELLLKSKHPGIYVGWGAVDAAEESTWLAERLVAPVATTFQGLSAFPGDHPFHVGVGFGESASPAAQKAFENCDCLLAVGARFAELATGSYGMAIPENLIHVDINPKVFHKNYPAKIAVEGDAREVLAAIKDAIKKKDWKSDRNFEQLKNQIASDKNNYLATWKEKKNDKKVSPGFFFQSLRQQLPDEAFMVVDDGKHTFLAAELFPVHQPRRFISPTDFNCMGYCVPAAIGVKLSNPDTPVVAIVGDGAFLMTGMELLTAATYGVGVVVFVFHDGELGQISQFQKIPLNRKTCTVLGDFNVEGIALATGVHFIKMKNDFEIEAVIKEAIEISEKGQSVLVDVMIDYSKKTLMTKGVVKTNLARFPVGEKVRFVSRAVKRHVLG